MPFTAADSERSRADFPALDRQHQGTPLAYLDGPAGSQIPRQVIDTMVGYYHSTNANHDGNFPTSRESDAIVLEARQSLAAFVGADDWRSISLGQNMTSLTFSLARAFGAKLSPGDEIVVTAIDHEANRGPWLGLERLGIVIREVALGADGRLDLDDFERQVTAKTKLVALTMASNALGTVTDIAHARELSKRVGAQLLVDAVHYAPHFPIDVVALDVDFLLCSAYKFYGPHMGVLYSRPGALEELPTEHLRVQSPEAPFRIETGTLNFAAIAATGAAVRYLASWGEGSSLRERLVDATSAIASYEHDLGRHYYETVRELPGIRAWGPDFNSGLRAPTVSITMEGTTAAEVAKLLGDRGIQVWDGHFYAVRAAEVLGLDRLGGLVRVGILMYNTRSEIDRLTTAIEEISSRIPIAN